MNNAVLAVLLLASVLSNERGQKLVKQKKAKRVRLVVDLSLIHVHVNFEVGTVYAFGALGTPTVHQEAPSNRWLLACLQKRMTRKERGTQDSSLRVPGRYFIMAYSHSP